MIDRLFWFNFMIFQWFGLRLATDSKEGLLVMGFVLPMSGWHLKEAWPEYYPRPPRRLFRIPW